MALAATIHIKPTPHKLEAPLVWLLIIVVLLVAFGPVLWLRPSPRERRLAALRAQARKDGLRVEIRRYPKQDLRPEDRVTAGGKLLDARLDAAVYLRPLETRLRQLSAWRILRGTDGLPALPGWVFEFDRKPDGAALRQALEELAPLLGELPADVVAVEVEPLDLGVYWLEGSGAGPAQVSSLAAWLGRAAARLGALDRALDPPDQEDQ